MSPSCHALRQETCITPDLHLPAHRNIVLKPKPKPAPAVERTKPGEVSSATKPVVNVVTMLKHVAVSAVAHALLHTVAVAVFLVLFGRPGLLPTLLATQRTPPPRRAVYSSRPPLHFGTRPAWTPRAPPAHQVVPIARPPLQFGMRPAWLVSAMRPSVLRDELSACVMDPSISTAAPSELTISHRGAPLQFPEHTREGYFAAATMGAAWMECDVAFTKDLELVCRHSQCDLHATTDILLTPLASKCTRKFSPASADGRVKADAYCCTSDITLEEFKTLHGKMDGVDFDGKTVEEYVGGTKAWRTDMYASRGTLVSHAESIRMFQTFGAKFTPELKYPRVSMPYNGVTQDALAQKLIDEYVAAGVDLKDVRPQSKHQPDVEYWLRAAPETEPILLDERYNLSTIEEMPAEQWPGDSFQVLYEKGLRIIAPPMWMLVTAGEDGKIVASKYAVNARAAGLKIVAWSLERSGPVGPQMDPSEYYFQSVQKAVYGDGTTMELLDVMVRDIGVIGVFSDWPGTVALYAACFGL